MIMGHDMHTTIEENTAMLPRYGLVPKYYSALSLPNDDTAPATSVVLRYRLIVATRGRLQRKTTVSSDIGYQHECGT